MRMSVWSSDVCSSDLHGGAWCWRQRRGQFAPAPGTAEVEPVEVGDLAVAAIADGGRGEQRCRFTAFDARQERSEPGGKRLRRQHAPHQNRSEEHTSELQSLMRNSYAVFCLKKTNNKLQIERRRLLKQHHNTT